MEKVGFALPKKPQLNVSPEPDEGNDANPPKRRRLEAGPTGSEPPTWNISESQQNLIDKLAEYVARYVSLFTHSMLTG